ncbi:hypothetical protein Ancab_003722 [Ancistrocladus abbreviatus]
MLSKLPGNLSPHISLKLLKTYCNSEDVTRARDVFDKIPEPNLQSWTILIAAYTKRGQPNEAIKLYSKMRNQRIQPDKLLLLSIAKACAASRDLTEAKKIHEDAIVFGFHTDISLGNALVDMYGKCKCHQGAQRVFSRLPVRDVISWTSLLACYVNCGLPMQALGVLREMGLSGLWPNSVTVSSALPACSELKDLNSGREIHGYIVKNYMVENVFVTSALVDMYASCSRLRQAELVFDNMLMRDVVSWNVILTAYFSHGECDKALSLFRKMQLESVKLNCDSWSAVIAGCTQNGNDLQALEMLILMQQVGFRPNQNIITSVLPACTNLESLPAGKEIHGYVFRNWISDDMTTATALVYMYAKCGELELSCRIFNMMPKKDVIAWNTVIIANSMHGNGEEALLLFHNMINSGVRTNSITFTGVFSGCSHSRLVDEGLRIFNLMSTEYLVEPDADHYSCVIDMLSRAGRLKEAYECIQRMPMEPTARAWGALLGGCRVYKNVELAKIAAKHLFVIEPENPGNYVSLSNIYVAAKLWNEASETRKVMRDRGILKKPGCSWIQVRNRIYTFVVGDKRNEQTDQIYKFLDEIGEKMKISGYLPNTDFVLHDLDQEEKEEVLYYHSEKLAVAFGVLNLAGKSSIRVFKNLRICGDCHNFIKYLANIVGIQIIVRDSVRFHHFKNGLCSCKDFW